MDAQCATCPTEEGEILAPELGYVAWHDWAHEREREGWGQRACTVCGLYTVWVPPDQIATRRCRGIAARGMAGIAAQCWNRTRHPSGLCHHHRDQMGSGDHDDA